MSTRSAVRSAESTASSVRPWRGPGVPDGPTARCRRVVCGVDARSMMPSPMRRASPRQMSQRSIAADARRLDVGGPPRLGQDPALRRTLDRRGRIGRDLELDERRRAAGQVDLRAHDRIGGSARDRRDQAARMRMIGARPGQDRLAGPLRPDAVDEHDADLVEVGDRRWWHGRARRGGGWRPGPAVPVPRARSSGRRRERRRCSRGISGGAASGEPAGAAGDPRLLAGQAPRRRLRDLLGPPWRRSAARCAAWSSSFGIGCPGSSSQPRHRRPPWCHRGRLYHRHIAAPYHAGMYLDALEFLEEERDAWAPYEALAGSDRRPARSTPSRPPTAGPAAT